MQSVCILLSKRPIPFVPCLGKMTATDQSLSHESKHTTKKQNKGSKLKSSPFLNVILLHIKTQTQSKIEKASFPL